MRKILEFKKKGDNNPPHPVLSPIGEREKAPTNRGTTERGKGASGTPRRSSPNFDSDRRDMIAKIHIATSELMVCDVCKSITYAGRCPNQKCKNFDGQTRAIKKFDYRRMLKSYTGKTSCRYMTNAELDKILNVLYAAGFIAGRKTPKPAKSEGEKIKEGDYLQESMDETKSRMIKAIEFKAKQRLGPQWYHRLHGYVEKIYKVQHLDKLNTKQLRGLFGFMGRA